MVATSLLMLSWLLYPSKLLPVNVPHSTIVIEECFFTMPYLTFWAFEF